MKKILLLLLIPNLVMADMIDTNWVVSSFVGDQAFADKRPIIGKTQEFFKGYAEGVFYTCDYAGQMKTYNKYSLNEFLANKEFDDFKKYQKELKFDSDVVYVHRISCNGKIDKDRAVIYPFVTTKKREKAYYLFEQAIYIMKNSKMKNSK